MVRVTFVMEQHVGLYSYYQYLRRFMDSEADIEATWVPVTYFDPHSALRRLTFLPASVRSALHGRAQVRQGIARAPGDVLFFNTQVPAALAYGRIRRRRYVISTDVTPVQYDRIGDEYGHRADRPGFLKSYKHRVNTRLFRGAARLLPWSRWVADSLVTDYGVAPERIEVIPPGIDLARWTPRSEAEEGGPVRILFVGADLRRKGGPLLIEAFRAVRPSGIELHLVTRGAMPGEPGLFVYNDMKNNSDALIDLYRRCDIFCLPTLADCLPMALLEAGAAGLPTISTNVAAIPGDRARGGDGIPDRARRPRRPGRTHPVARTRSRAPGADGARGPGPCGDPLQRAPQRPSRARGPAGDGRDPERLQGGLTGGTPRRPSPSTLPDRRMARRVPSRPRIAGPLPRTRPRDQQGQFLELQGTGHGVGMDADVPDLPAHPGCHGRDRLREAQPVGQPPVRPVSRRRILLVPVRRESLLVSAPPVDQEDGGVPFGLECRYLMRIPPTSRSAGNAKST